MKKIVFIDVRVNVANGDFYLCLETGSC